MDRSGIGSAGFVGVEAAVEGRTDEAGTDVMGDRELAELLAFGELTEEEKAKEAKGEDDDEMGDDLLSSDDELVPGIDNVDVMEE